VGTSATATVDVTVFDLPTATVSLASGPPSVGAPATFALTSATPAGTQLTSYVLFISGADTFTISGNGPPPANQDITFAVAGDYTVQFTVTNDAAGTSDVSEIPVQVAP
jgi:hypothetical protein